MQIFQRGLRRRGARGASGVEYALLASLILVGSAASIELMDERVEEHYSETARDVGQIELNYFDVTTTTCAACEPPPTTTAANTPETEVDDEDWSGNYGIGWDWVVYGRLRFEDESDGDLSGATVQYTIVLATGESASYTATTNGLGRITIVWGQHASSAIFPATITIDSVTKGGVDYTPTETTFEWDD